MGKLEVWDFDQDRDHKPSCVLHIARAFTLRSMAISNSKENLVNREILIDPDDGYEWMLVGTTPEPLDIELPEKFSATISDVLFEYEIARAVVGACDVCLGTLKFHWIGLFPWSDSEEDLGAGWTYCRLILSTAVPVLMRSDALPNGYYFETSAKVFIRGLARVMLESYINERERNL